MDTDEHEPVARMYFSSTFKNTRRHDHKKINETDINRFEHPNNLYLKEMPSKIRREIGKFRR